MACKICESMRSVWQKFAAQRARRAERRKAQHRTQAQGKQ